MADIAGAAGVSRGTLYKEFGSRGSLAQALVLREADRLIDPVAKAIAEHGDDPSAAITTALQLFLTTAAAHPLVQTVLADEGADELLRLFTTQGSPVLRRAVRRLADILREGWPQVDQANIDALAECMVRLAVSLASMPDSPANLSAEVISSLFTPYIERVLASAGDPDRDNAAL